ncbi:hypothetical protein V1290_007118 [Bradyrhizobium sp. AZCC 1578]|uniref:SGNH/GDSL hydrolase family protein n=1 Tax=Bradyrhizobium sp. AZCC 1578 TaxID=3117027 RepID=UPI002FF19434
MKDRYERKELVFSAILGLMLLCLLEALSFLTLAFSVTPLKLNMGLPSGAASGGQLAHPYKSYMYWPAEGYWGKGMPPYVLAGNSYDYALFDQGISFNEFGHGVLPIDRDISRRKKGQGEYRILFLGGSTTFQPWPFLTAELLSRTLGRDIHAISAATGGYTSQENVADLVTSGSAYDADMIVAYLPVNDIWHAARWPKFKRDYTHFRTAVSREFKAPNFKQPDSREIFAWPFTVRLVQTLLFNKRMEAFLSAASINEIVFVKPTPDELGIWIDKNSYEGTVDAVIDNILTMKAYAEARGITFILVTQKIFKTGAEADSFISKYVLDSIDRIKASPRIMGIPIVEMNVLFPEPLTEATINQVKQEFPGRRMDFSQPEAYDSMHFSPASLYIFASTLAADLKKRIH